MKYAFSQFKDRLPSLTWDKQILADKLSLIGHETEIYGETIDVTLTSNRKDCKELNYLLFDLAGVYDLELTEPLSGYGHGPEIVVTAENINKLLGSNIDQLKLKELERLGFIVTETGVQPPEFRDVLTVADVAEEVVRIIGFDALAIEPLSKETAKESAEFVRLQSIKFALTNAGWTETATSSFSSKGDVELKNPFTETEPYLRHTLLGGLLQTLARNPYMKRAKFFEIGEIVNPNEQATLGLITSGYKNTNQVTAELNKTLGILATFEPIESAVAANYEAKQGTIFFYELDISSIHPSDSYATSFSERPLPSFKPISKYPPLIRDHNLDSREKIEALRERTSKEFTELLTMEEIDSYTNPDTGEQSITVRFIFQQFEQSFTEAEISVIDYKLDTFLK